MPVGACMLEGKGTKVGRSDHYIVRTLDIVVIEVICESEVSKTSILK